MALRRAAALAVPFAGAAWYYNQQQPNALQSWAAASTLVARADAPSGHPSGLDPKGWVALKLKEREQVTHNTVRLVFELPAGPGAPADLPVASCVLVKAPIGSDDGKGGRKAVLRPYTPTTPPGTKGSLELVVKSYDKGVMSKHLAGLKAGKDSLEFKGPIPKIAYAPNEKAHVGMIAGGTGVTPMLQVIEAALADPQDRTRLTLCFANVAEGDILLKKRLDALAAKHPARFSVRYLVEKPSFGGIFWKGGVGRVTKEELAREMPRPGSGGIVYVCGPPPMMKAVSGDKAPDKSQGELEGMLRDMGYKAEEVYKF